MSTERVSIFWSRPGTEPPQPDLSTTASQMPTHHWASLRTGLAERSFGRAALALRLSHTRFAFRDDLILLTPSRPWFLPVWLVVKGFRAPAWAARSSRAASAAGLPPRYSGRVSSGTLGVRGAPDGLGDGMDAADELVFREVAEGEEQCWVGGRMSEPVMT